MDKIRAFRDAWAEFSVKTKLMAVGTFALIILSVLLATGNAINSFFGEGDAWSFTSEEEGLVAADAKPIPYSTEEAQMVASFMDILANENCNWIATEDPICALQFNKTGFDAYQGDIKTPCAVEFYTIETTREGRSGVWRVWHDDHTAVDARFAFVQDRERGIYTLTSSAFPTCHTYETRAFTSEDLMDW